jgi:cyclophilin family peptidyl-prolyl cis-trans isomerase
MKGAISLFALALAAAVAIGGPNRVRPAYVGRALSGPALLHAQTPPKQAVVDTSAGRFIIDLRSETAPNHAACFTKQAQAGAYDGTSFHRMVKLGMVQGGDPLTTDPSKRALYGTGGLNMVKAEARAPKMTAGSVAAVLVPGRPDSAGAQFFIVVIDQPALDGQYTVFGDVTDGMDVVQKISQTPVDDNGLATARVEIKRITIRDTPPPTPEPFSTETVEELAAWSVHGVWARRGWSRGCRGD